MDVLQGVRVARHHDRLLRELRLQFPEAVGGHTESSLRELVRVGAEKAAEFAIIEVDEVVRYVRLLLRFGPGFDADPRLPAAGYLLRQSGKSGPTKLAEVEAWALSREQSVSP